MFLLSVLRQYLSIVLALCLPWIGMSAEINGVVTDSSRKPAAGATVRMVESREHYFVEEHMKPIAEATTDSSGKFSLDCRSTGTVVLVASGDGLRCTKFTVDCEQASRRVLGLALEPGEEISGTVLDDKGRSIAGAVVGPLAPSIDAERAIAQKVIPQWTRTDESGKFTFGSVLSGLSYHFLVHAPGMQVTDVPARPGQKDLKIRMKTGGSQVPGLVFSRKDPPSRFAGIPIRANGNGFDEIVLADKQGQFQFTGLPGGEYSIEPLPSFPSAMKVAQVTLPRDEETTIELEISSGYYVRGQTIDVASLGPAAGVPLIVNDLETTSNVSGLFEAGPFTLAIPVSISIPADASFRMSSDNRLMDIPPPNGFDDIEQVRIRVERLRNVKVRLDGFEQTTRPVTLHILRQGAPEQRVSVSTNTAELKLAGVGEFLIYGESGALSTEMARLSTVDEGEEVPLKLDAAAIIAGLVIDPSDASETSGGVCRVEVEYDAGADTKFSLRDTPCSLEGDFLFRALPRGSFTVVATNRSATAATSRTLEAVAGLNDPLKIQFPEGRLFAGRVVDKKGNPLPATNIQCIYQSDTGQVQALTIIADEAGNFRKQIPAELVTAVSVKWFGFAPYSVSSVALPQTSYNIVLEKAPAFQVRVLAEPASQWTVMVMESELKSEGVLHHQLASRQVSRASVHGGDIAGLDVPGSGRYRIVASNSRGDMAVSDPIQWSPQVGTSYLDLNPNILGKLTGRVETTSDGNFEIVAMNMTLPDSEAQTEFKVESSGDQFAFEGLPPGDYLVLATGSGYYGKATNIEVNANKVVDVLIQPSARQ